MAPYPGLDQTYELSDAMKRGALYVKPRRPLPDPMALFRGELRVDEPIEFVPDLGKHVFDYLPSTEPRAVLISAKIQEALRPFSGWRTYPVTIFDRTGEVLPGYAGLSITGRSGPLLTKRPSPYEFSRCYFDPKTWDGSDLFAPAGTSFMLLLPDVASAIKAAGVTNIALRLASDI
jgi:hypothetical protein